MIDLKPACQTMIRLLNAVTDEQSTLSTPCAKYLVSDLIDHVDDVSQGFAALARKQPGSRRTPATLSADYRAEVAEHVCQLGSAWDDPAAWQGTTAPDGAPELSNETWGRIAFTEIVVHGWDLARATGQLFILPEHTMQACFEHVAEFVPNAPVPELWGPAVETPSGAALLDRIVAITGRDPQWDNGFADPVGSR